MNCDSLLRMLDEIPLPRWTHEQRTSAHEHCRSCDSCLIRLTQQERLFVEFDKMVLPEPSTTFALEIKGEPGHNISSNPGVFLPNAAPFLSNAAPFLSAAAPFLYAAAALFLGVGSVYQLFREGGLSLSWFADGTRLESAIALFYSSPVLSVALILVGLVYCLAREPNETQERE